ncbi:MAG: peptide chain release factor N(5)-glutamine methyltransferase [Halioglobus sp.]
MPTVQELLRASDVLPGDSARRDTEILLCHCLDKPRSWLYTWPEASVEGPVLSKFNSLLTARSEGQPIAYLTGEREFWSLTLKVNSHTLIPRPETEGLVEWALSLELPSRSNVADLGTGSGAIALALASERPDWHLLAVDSSESALAVARENADTQSLANVELLSSSWFDGLGERSFDLVVSNPPYVDEHDPHLGQGDVRFEPTSALVAKHKGFADLQAIVNGSRDYLRKGGWLLLEHGYEQAATLRDLLKESGFSDVTSRVDLAGHERVTGGCWHAE